MAGGGGGLDWGWSGSGAGSGARAERGQRRWRWRGLTRTRPPRAPIGGHYRRPRRGVGARTRPPHKTPPPTSPPSGVESPPRGRSCWAMITPPCRSHPLTQAGAEPPDVASPPQPARQSRSYRRGVATHSPLGSLLCVRPRRPRPSYRQQRAPHPARSTARPRAPPASTFPCCGGWGCITP